MEFEEKFRRHYRQRIVSDQDLLEQFDKRLALFKRGQLGAPLNDHPLKHPMKGLRAFSVTDDIRVIYKETGKVFIFKDIGSHSQVYD
jgi:mRNA-degrading endonuclease YafQ of YafQ-DinJ toxin-antitoxin module